MAKKKKLWLKIGLPLVAVLVIGGMVAANLQKSKNKGSEVTVDKAGSGRLVETVSGTGRVQPEVQVKISANVAGRLTEIRVKEGDRVKKNDLLVRLDRERYEAAVEQYRSGLKSAQASLAKSKSELARIRELSQRGMASAAELEAVEAQNALNAAQVEQSEAALKQAQDDLAKTAIYSPMDGIVSQLNKEVGEMAMGAQFQEDVILVVADLSRMEVVIEVDENDVVNVALLDTSRIRVDAYPDTTFKGVVREIAHTATTRGLGTPEELTNFEVKITMLEVPPTLRPGMSATADVITQVEENTLKVPIQSVVMRDPRADKARDKKGGKKAEPEEAQADTGAALAADQTGQPAPSKPQEVVFRVAGGKVVMVPVVTGISSDTEIQILSGVAEGDSVVTGPFRTLSQQLKDGDDVQIKKGAAGSAEKRSQAGPDPEMMEEM
ncbi:MAG: efflux RND transporter periplasmic adaptor subunit [Candidatus Zixiibacteriota bacterium]|nr:MAG: efflux RND transporter periplasmic adaptor subunit [candidate division Zixibacteria bacterium]